MRERLLDAWDNFWDVLRYGAWWQKLILLGVPAALIFVVFWFRPLPSEIPEKLAYLDQSANSFYADGAASVMADLYYFEKLDGSRKPWKRDTWRDELKRRYQKIFDNGWTLKQTTSHRSFYWTGPFQLVETVAVHSLVTNGPKMVKDSKFRMAMTWTKTQHGWLVKEVRLLDGPRE